MNLGGAQLSAALLLSAELPTVANLVGGVLLHCRPAKVSKTIVRRVAIAVGDLIANTNGRAEKSESN